jgi:hypothetical protein
VGFFKRLATISFPFIGMGRFARGNIKMNSADAQEKYKQYCQHVFELQNENLGCADKLSSDEGSDNEDSDEDMASHVEKMLGNQKGGMQRAGRGKFPLQETKKAYENEDEKAELLALQQLVHGNAPGKPGKDGKKADGKGFHFYMC